MPKMDRVLAVLLLRVGHDPPPTHSLLIGASYDQGEERQGLFRRLLRRITDE
jgi:hypothetical protein